MLIICTILIIGAGGRGLNLNRMAILVLIGAGLLSVEMGVIGGKGIGVYNGIYVVTGISQFIGSLISILGAGCIIVAQKIRTSEYGTIGLIVTIGMLSLINSNEIISVLIGVELQTLGLYVIASLDRGSERSTAAGLKYYLLGGLTSCIIGLGLSLWYGVTGVTNIEELNILLTVATGVSVDSERNIVPVVLIIIGLLFKMGAAPFHSWLADVIDGVPTIIATWLAVVSKISIIIILLMLYNKTFININNAGECMVVSIIMSLIVGSLVGVVQSRIKRLLAYSSIAHGGYMLIGIIVGNNIGVGGLIFYIVQYTITTLNIFIIIIVFREVVGGSVEYISQLKGVHKTNPLLGVSLGISLLSSAGIPPLVGFFGKLKILSTAIEMGGYTIIGIAVGASIISGFYYIKVVKVMCFEEESCKNGQCGEPCKSIIIGIISLVIILYITSPEGLYNSIQVIT